MARLGAAFARRVAARIAAEGRSVTIQDPAGNQITVPAVFQNVDARLVDGVTIQASDREALVAALDLAGDPLPGGLPLQLGPIEPDAGWWLIDDGTDWTVVHVEAEEPGATPLLYTLRIRR